MNPTDKHFGVIPFLILIFQVENFRVDITSFTATACMKCWKT